MGGVVGWSWAGRRLLAIWPSGLAWACSGLLTVFRQLAGSYFQKAGLGRVDARFCMAVGGASI